MPDVTRRRAFRILAAAAGVPLLIAGVRAAAPQPRFFSWQGEVLGAAAGLTLWHADASLARRTILKVRREIERCEAIFSLQRDSEIVRLNRDGALTRPSADLVAVIDASQRLGRASNGAFDITVQPLWRAYEAHFWSRAQVAPDIAARAAGIARRLVDFRRVQAGAARIGLAPGMAITLNGIPQGYITDRVATWCAMRASSKRWSISANGARSAAIRTAVRGMPRRARAGSRSPTRRSRSRPAPARASSRPENSITSSIRRPARAPTGCTRSPWWRRAP